MPDRYEEMARTALDKLQESSSRPRRMKVIAAALRKAVAEAEQEGQADVARKVATAVSRDPSFRAHQKIEHAAARLVEGVDRDETAKNASAYRGSVSYRSMSNARLRDLLDALAELKRARESILPAPPVTNDKEG